MSHVVFRKQVSDGNYGSETAEVMLDLPDDWNDSAVALALQGARELVHAELARSPNSIVRLYGGPAPSTSDEELPL